MEQTVQDNIALSSLQEYTNLGVIDDSTFSRIAEEKVGELRVKTPSTKQLVRNLSGGNQQKVIIARWLLKDCDILVFDEPTRGIDVGAKDEIYTILHDLVAQGKSIIVISSELPEVLRLSDRVAVLADGHVAGILDKNEASPESIMELATQTLKA